MGTGRIFQRGNVWWIDYSFEGRRFKESARSQKKKDAQALLRKRMGEIGRGLTTGPDEKLVTFDDLERIILDDYAVTGRKSEKRLRTSLKHLKGYFGFDRAKAITTDRVRAYIVARREEGAADSTIQKDCAALKRMFRLAVQAEVLSSAPHVPVPQARNVRTSFLDGGELEAVIAALPEHLKPVARFASITGWRKQEVLTLTWAHVDRLAGVVRLKPGTTKNDQGREVPYGVIPELVDVIEGQRAHTDEVERERGAIVQWVFHRNGKQMKDIRQAWDKACTDAGLPGAWFHDLRRTAVRNLERASVPRSVAMKITGHLTESVYRRYAIADQVAMEEGLEKLAKFRSEQTAKRKVILFSAPGSGTITAQSEEKAG